MNENKAETQMQETTMAVTKTSEQVLGDLNVLMITGETFGAQNGGIITTLPCESFEDKVFIYNKVSHGDDLDDYVNKPFALKHLIYEPILKNNDTGGQEAVAKMVLIDDKGNSFVTISKGILQDLQKICSLFGSPDKWPEPIKVEVYQVATSGNRKVNRLRLVAKQ